MSRIAILGSGAWGTAIALSLHRRGGHQITLWAHTTGTRAADHRRRRKRAVPSWLSPPLRHRGHVRLRGRHRCRHRRFHHPVGIPAAHDAPHPQLPARRSIRRQRHQRDRRQNFLPHDPGPLGDSRACRPSALHRRALRSQLRSRSGAGPAHRRHRCLQRPSGRLSGSAGVLLRNPPPLHLHRRRSASSSAARSKTSSPSPPESPSASASAQLHRRPHHPRHRRNHPPRRGLRRAPRNPRRPLRRRRPGAHLHRLASAATAPSARRSARAANCPRFSTRLGGKVAEGVLTTRAALGLARQHGIEMPITEQMELILDEGKDPREAIRDLMLRPGKHEH